MGNGGSTYGGCRGCTRDRGGMGYNGCAWGQLVLLALAGRRDPPGSGRSDDKKSISQGTVTTSHKAFSPERVGDKDLLENGVSARPLYKDARV